VFDFRILGGEQMSGDRCRERWFSSIPQAGGGLGGALALVAHQKNRY